MEAAPAEAAGKSRLAPQFPPSHDALRLQVAERLAAHRSRRAQLLAPPATKSAQSAPQPTDARAARIAATVAQRYAQSQSYRAFLAAEAERATQQAQAAAEVAAFNARAVAAAQQKLLDAFDESAGQQEFAAPLPHSQDFEPAPRIEPPQELSLWPEPEQAAAPQPAPSLHHSTTPRRHKTPPGPEPRTSPTTIPSPSGFTVRLYEDAARLAHTPFVAAYSGSSSRLPERSDAEARALDEEIAFRQAPVFEEPVGPPMPLPANLIEFPRQLVASRKARPRYAEGPLRDEALAEPSDGQLRIFEVDPAQISTAPPPPDAAPEPQWTSIWLDSPAASTAAAPGTPLPGIYASVYAPDSSHEFEAEAAAAPPQVAPIGRRILAAAVNAAIVLTGAIAFAAAFVATTRQAIPWQSFPSLGTLVLELAGRVPPPPGIQPSLLLAAFAATCGFLYLLYHALFFSFSEATPGMRCARIALCTFDDENPTRSAMRRRMLAILLSACALGLGFVWATLDEDRLAWHDRISRMYQRSY
jgi:uncharacterized RDD family membrane protein YckC